MAFDQDKEVLQQLNKLDSIQKGEWNDFVEEIIFYLPEYCMEKGLNLFAIFDQHNGIPLQLREQLPFRYPETLASISNWKQASTLTIVSASANNEYYLKVAAKSSWPQFFMYDGFTEKEFNEWVNTNDFFIPTNDDNTQEFLQLVEELTS